MNVPEMMLKEHKKIALEKFKEIQKFVEKYDPLKTLFILSKRRFFEKRHELPVINLLFNLSLNGTEEEKKNPSLEDIGLLEKAATDYIESTHWINSLGEKDELVLISKRQHIINLINPEIYLFQLNYKIAEIFRNISDDFNYTFGFRPIDAWTFSDRINKIYEGRFINNSIKYLFTKEDVKEGIEFEKEDEGKVDKALNSYLDSISTNFGSSEQYQSIMDKDISWEKPIIKTPRGYWGANLVQNQYGIPAQLEKIIKENSGLWNRYERAKSKYAEELAYKSFKKIFPSKVYKNMKYIYESKTYEVDILVEYDGKIILAEVKSGSSDLASSIKRNNIKGGFKKILKKSYEQTQKASGYIMSEVNPRFFNNSETISISKGELLKIFPICIYLENLMAITQGLKKAKLNSFFENNQYPWAVNLLELEIISNHITYPSLFLHYIQSRLDVQIEERATAQDELSYFGLYFNQPAGGFLFNNQYSMTTIDSEFIKIFDDFYTDNNRAVAPVLGLDKRLDKFIKEWEYLYQMGVVHGHSEIFSCLLNISSQQLCELFNKIENCIVKTRKDKKKHSVCMIFKNFGVSFQSHYGDHFLQESIITYGKIKKYETKTPKWVALGANADPGDPWLINNAFLDLNPFKKDIQMEKIVSEFLKSKKIEPH